jgi:hypothetical protein
MRQILAILKLFFHYDMDGYGLRYYNVISEFSIGEFTVLKVAFWGIINRVCGNEYFLKIIEGLLGRRLIALPKERPRKKG